jgi:hypothetical protein
MITSQNSFELHAMSSRWSLTNPFHHDRGRVVFAVSPRRGEQGALGRRLRRGQQFCAVEIAAKQMNAILLVRVSAHSSAGGLFCANEIAASLVKESQAWDVVKHRQGHERSFN